MIIAIGADHRGFSIKELLKEHFSEHQFIDVGAYNDVRSDYPLFAHQVAQLLQKNIVTKGILLCATGIGMAIVANRYKGIYAGVIWNEKLSKESREDDNTNVLVLPCDGVDFFDPIKITKIWLETEFNGERYAYRLALIDDYKEEI